MCVCVIILTSLSEIILYENKKQTSKKIVIECVCVVCDVCVSVSCKCVCVCVIELMSMCMSKTIIVCV